MSKRRGDPVRTVVSGSCRRAQTISTGTSDVFLATDLLTQSTRLTALSDLWKNYAFRKLKFTVFGMRVDCAANVTPINTGRIYGMGYIAGSTSATTTTITVSQVAECTKVKLWQHRTFDGYRALLSQDDIGHVASLYPLTPLVLGVRELVTDQTLKRFKIGTDNQFTMVFATDNTVETNASYVIHLRIDYEVEFTEPAGTSLVPRMDIEDVHLFCPGDCCGARHTPKTTVACFSSKDGFIPVSRPCSADCQQCKSVKSN